MHVKTVQIRTATTTEELYIVKPKATSHITQASINARASVRYPI